MSDCMYPPAHMVGDFRMCGCAQKARKEREAKEQAQKTALQIPVCKQCGTEYPDGAYFAGEPCAKCGSED